MKKLLIFLLSLLVCLSTAFAIACNGPEEPEHTHAYDKEVVSADFLKSEATCESKAIYYKSCECGEKGTETFETGSLADHVYESGKCKWCEESEPAEPHTHVFDKEVVSSDYLSSEATCEIKAKYFKSCACGEKGTETFETGSLADHVYESGKCKWCEVADPSISTTIGNVTKTQWESAFTFENVTIAEYSLIEGENLLMFYYYIDGEDLLIDMGEVKVPMFGNADWFRLDYDFSSCYDDLEYEDGKYYLASFDVRGDGTYILEDVYFVFEEGVLTSLSAKVTSTFEGETNTEYLSYEFSNYGTTVIEYENDLPISSTEWDAIFAEENFNNLTLAITFPQGTETMTEIVCFANDMEKITVVGIDGVELYHVGDSWFTYSTQLGTVVASGVNDLSYTYIIDAFKEVVETVRNIYFMIEYEESSDIFYVMEDGVGVTVKIVDGKLFNITQIGSDGEQQITYSYTVSDMGTTSFELPFDPNDENKPDHTHVFDQEKVEAKYLDKEATCENKATYFKSCACGEKGSDTFETGDPLDHDYGDFSTNNDGTHSKICANNPLHVITENCEGGEATCSERAICDICESEYGDLEDHPYSANWSYNLTHHWKEAICDCEGVEDIEYGAHNIVSGSCSICGKQNEQYDSDENYTPVVRFAITSDVHLRDNGAYNSLNQLNNYINTAYAYSESQSDYSNLDGIFFLGDNTNNGYATEQRLFFNTVNSLTKEGTTSRAIMGNHEYYATRGSGSAYTQASMTQAPLDFMSYSGYDDDDWHGVIGGYHVIMVSLDRYGSNSTWGDASDYGKNVYYTQAKIDWLEEQLEIALADDPTGTKPIIVAGHIAPSCGVLGSSATAYDKRLNTLLNDYPNAVYFSGHTHRPISDPRSIWQGNYTAIQTGTLAYLGLSKFADGNPAGNVVDPYGSFDSVGEDGLRSGYMYYLIEIDANNVMKVIVYDMLNNEIYSETLIDSFGDVSGFDYTEDRAEYTDETYKPEFAEGAEATLVSNNYKLVEIKVPKATCNTTIQAYKVTTYYYKTSRPKGWAKLCTDYKLSGFYFGSASPDEIILTIDGLDADTNYKFEIVALSCFNQTSDPLTLEATTSPAITGTEFAPDIFSLGYSGGKAVNLVDGIELGSKGTPTLNNGETTFDGESIYSYNKMYEWYMPMRKGFAVETYFKINTAGAQTIIGNTENGGFSITYGLDGKISFNVAFSSKSQIYDYSSSYTKATSTASYGVGQYLHVVGVYDGTNVLLYVNGQQVASTTKGASYFTCPSWSAQNLVIGADTYGFYDANSYAKITVKSVNVYCIGMSQEQVTAKYNQAIA